MDAMKYAPLSNTPDGKSYPSTPQHRYALSHSGHGDSIYSPLGLADIRSMNDASIMSPAQFDPYGVNDNGSVDMSNYVAPWPTYALDWCKSENSASSAADSGGKIAVGSYVEDGHNYIQILDTKYDVQATSDIQSAEAPQPVTRYTKTAEATHSYPVTRILWEPPSSKKQSTDLLATSGDHLRLWSLPTSNQYNSNNTITNHGRDPGAATAKLTPLALLSNSKTPEHTAPLTSLDWNTISPSLIITSSIDTTCTIWDIPTLTAKTQLIAHDKEVFDVRFCAKSIDVFVSCGADGSVRMFDLRSLEHSTIIYEPSEKGTDSSSHSPGSMSPGAAQSTLNHSPPLLRLAASPHDAHLLATFAQDANVIRILDVRQPGQALLELRGHSSAINCIEWCPSRRGTLASGGDDSLVLVWDLLSQGSVQTIPGNTTSNRPSAHLSETPGNAASATSQTTCHSPVATWQCDYEVSNLSWAPSTRSSSGDWLGVSAGRSVWGVHM